MPVGVKALKLRQFGRLFVESKSESRYSVSRNFFFGLEIGIIFYYCVSSIRVNDSCEENKFG